MKSVILSFLFLCSSSIVLQAQEKWQHEPSPYFSFHVGTFPVESQWLMNMSISGGYQFSKWVGVGLSNGNSAMLVTEGPSTGGLALQYRVLPGGKVILSADAGLIYRHRKSCDFTCEYRYVSGTYPYFALNAYFRLTKVFTLGVGGVALPLARSEQWFYDDVDVNGEPMWYLQREVDHRFETAGFMVTLGVNIK